MAKDVKMYYAESDILKIQLKTNMYIKEYGPQGAFHLAREVIQNAIDECIDPNSNGDKVIITYDELEDKLTCEDNGRGFPEKDYPLDIFCTKIQSGSKFFRDQSGETSGEFGLGITAVNALSAYFRMQSFRQKEKTLHTITFENGEKVKDTIVPLERGKKHGSAISYIPSKKYLGADTVIPYSDVLDWVRRISHLDVKGTSITFKKVHGSDVIETHDFSNNKFEDLIKDISSSPSVKPISFKDTVEFKEEVQGFANEIKDAFIRLTVVLTYDSNETYYDSYCNFTNTTAGGSHVDAVEEAICRFFQKKAKDSLTEREKNSMDIVWSDIKDGLKLLINLSTNSNVQFVGNAKEKINSKAIVPYVKKIVSDNLEKIFENNQELLKSYIKIIKLNARARIEMNKVKSQVGKTNRSSFDDYVIKKYRPAVNTGKKYRELFLIEGDSAAGSASTGRDPYTQAILAFRGNPANAFTVKTEDLLNPRTGNAEWLQYVNILQTGWGKDFNIDKCYFDKIIIMTDADIDGLGIASGICAFHIKVMPEIVKAGKLYKSLPPLYRIAGDKEFVHSKEEFVELYQNKVMKVYKIQPLAYDDKFSNKEFHQFILDTVDYQEDLIKIAKHYGVNKFLIEQIAACFAVGTPTKCELMTSKELMKFISDQKHIKEIMNFIQKRFPEIVLEDDSYLRGIADGSYQSIAINTGLMSRLSDLFDIYRKYGIYLEVSEKKSENKVMTIGEFLDLTTKYVPKILQRYKGLGEMDAMDLWKTTMDPRDRVLIRLTMEDLEKEIDTFNKLHGGKSKDIARRKEMVGNFKVKATDLDN